MRAVQHQWQASQWKREKIKKSLIKDSIKNDLLVTNLSLAFYFLNLVFCLVSATEVIGMLWEYENARLFQWRMTTVMKINVLFSSAS